MVLFCTQDSCAAYATPFSRGRLNHESGPAGMKCISPNRAFKIDVFPEPLGPIMRLILPGWKRSSSSMRRQNWRLVIFSTSIFDHENMELWKPIPLGCSCALPAKNPMGSSLGFVVKESNSSVCESNPWTSSKTQTYSKTHVEKEVVDTVERHSAWRKRQMWF
jgi:hypothetical protein